MKATELIKSLEDHCNEELNCSTRLRFQITQSIQHMIDEHESLKERVSSVLNGANTYDPKVYATRRHNKS